MRLIWQLGKVIMGGLMQQLLLRGYCLGAISEIYNVFQRIVFVIETSLEPTSAV